MQARIEVSEGTLCISRFVEGRTKTRASPNSPPARLTTVFRRASGRTCRIFVSNAASVESTGWKPRLGQVLRDPAVSHRPRAPEAASRFDLGFRARLANIGKQMVIEAGPDRIRPAERAAGEAENALNNRRDCSIASRRGKSISGVRTGGGRKVGGHCRAPAVG